MLRPERMSKVSITGSKRVMDDAVEAVHELNLLHLSNYDGEWKGFEPGNPTEGADEASEKLVTVRSLKNILGVDPDDAGPQQMVADGELAEELERLREEANDLDDRRTELEEELRTIEERLDRAQPFADLGIDLDLLGGYDSLEVAVGRGDRDAVNEALAAADDVAAFETFTDDADNTVAVFAHPAEGASDVISDALVGVDFDPQEVPEGKGSPGEYVEQLRQRKRKVESELETVENEIEDLRLDAAGFLLAAEEQLTIEVQKSEAPLQFATTRNSFVAEGWIPTDRLDALESALATAVGDHVEIEELERARYTEEGHPEEPEPVEDHHDRTGEPTAAADGGTSTMNDDPPVILDNPRGVRPMELLVETVDRPKYTEFDPTWLIFLTFPAFFGFMIGDIGYGILYMAIGYGLYAKMDSRALRALGGVALWAGLFTLIFGILYGEIFGLHHPAEWIWGGHPPMHKGLQPADIEYAQAWMVLVVLVGLLHMTVGYLLSFLKEMYGHGLKAAVFESGSWVVLMLSAWAWIFSRHAEGAKPDFLFEVFDGHPFPFGFSGLPEMVAFHPPVPVLESAGVTLPMIFVVVGLVMLGIGEGAPGLIESLQVLVHALSYTRITAVLIGKAGMAFVVNLLVFGAYTEATDHGTEFHFLYFSDSEPAVEAGKELIFPGLIGGGGGIEMVVGAIVGVLVLVIGHLVVLGLGVTSAGLQGVRLEYVEFFNKFYDGGGRTYNPFGYSRKHTTEQ